MADDQDQSQKTEQPTEKRLHDAIEKGNVPVSKEVGTLALLAAATLLVGMMAPGFARRLTGLLLPFVENPENIRLEGIGDGATGLFGITARLAVIALPTVAILIGAAIFGAVIQGNVVIAPDRVKPKLERISLRKGLERLFSLSALVEFVKGIVKMAVVGVAVAIALIPSIDRAQAMIDVDVAALPALLRDLILQLLIAVLCAVVVIAVMDVMWRRYEWRRNLRMSVQEIRDEFKQSEGDPFIKAKLKELRRQRARRRMMAAVPDATVVVMNPTHFAVALKYERGKTPAPLCVAKGQDRLALRIRAKAQEHGVPVVENPPLARLLYRVVELEELVPAEHYRAVAEIILHVQKLAVRAKAPEPAAR